MQQATELKKQLQSIHRKSYPAYKSLKGSYQFGHYILSIDHVQGDPFASPSHISVKISHKTAGFPADSAPPRPACARGRESRRGRPVYTPFARPKASPA